LTIAERNESFGEPRSAKLNTTRPERRESFAHQQILLGHAQKIAFQSTAFWAIHPEAIVLLRKVAKRASNDPSSCVFCGRARDAKSPHGTKIPVSAARASKFRIVFVRASSEGLSSEKGKASTS